MSVTQRHIIARSVVMEEVLGVPWDVSEVVDSNDGIVPCCCELLRPPRQFNIQSTVHGQNGTALHVCIGISTGPGTKGIW